MSENINTTEDKKVDNPDTGADQTKTEDPAGTVSPEVIRTIESTVTSAVAKATQTKTALGQELAAPSDQYIQNAEARSLNFLNPKLWQAINIAAETFSKSNALPATMDNTPKVVMALQAGYEMGLTPIQSLNSFYFVNGKLSLYGSIVIQRILRYADIEWIQNDKKAAEVKITRRDNGASMTGKFTIDQAREKGLITERSAWKKWPERMLRYKAIGDIAAFIVPEALSGLVVGGDLETVEYEVKSGEISNDQSQAVLGKKKNELRGVTPDTIIHDEATNVEPESDSLFEGEEEADGHGSLSDALRDPSEEEMIEKIKKMSIDLVPGIKPGACKVMREYGLATVGEAMKHNEGAAIGIYSDLPGIGEQTSNEIVAAIQKLFNDHGVTL